MSFLPNLFQTSRPLLLAGSAASTCVLGISLLRASPPNASHHLLRCDSGPGAPFAGVSQEFTRYERQASTPVLTRDSRGKPRSNPRALRQVSAGSIAGLLGGITVSTFSKPLALLIGLLVLGIQGLESRGIRVVPYGYLQRYVSSINLRSSIEDNAAFKLSFGLTFILAGFATF